MIEARLADFAHGATAPADALAVLRLSLLDWCAVAYAGRHEPVGQILRDQATEEGGAAQAGLIGAQIKVPARMAALVNGTISHALDYDDTHFAHIGHPSVAVIPAALAVAQMRGAAGRAMQEAALIGAEASIRVGLWLGRAHYQTGFHQTATAGAFGACLAACRILSLNAEQTRMALGLVSTRASGLKSQFGTMGKPMNAGIAAANGVEAACLAARGFVSASAGLGGEQGFGPTHHGASTASAFEGLGTEWHFETVSHKFHACCHGLHAMIEALVQFNPAPVDQIARIDVQTNPRWLRVCNIAAPATGLEAKFSYRQVAAMRLMGHDTSLPDSFSDALCEDTALAELQGRVQVIPDDNLGEMQAQVVRTLRNGDTAQQFHDLSEIRPIEDRERRIRAKAAALIGSEKAEALWRDIQADASPDNIAAQLAD